MNTAKWKEIKNMKFLYLMLLLPVIHLVLFKYVPMYGMLMAFENYRYADGILGSSWNNFAHFKTLFSSFSFLRVFKNTMIISCLKLIFGFPAPILLALLINEVYNMRFKKVIQTISYLPHFMSWVVLGGILREVLSPQRGIVNYIIGLLGGQPINFLASRIFFVPVLIISDIWQSCGWGAVVYLAALTSIDPELYESADMDGANKLHKALYISIPSIIPIITVLFILRLGHILNVGFDQIFNLYNPLVYEVADVIDTYVYRVGVMDAKYDFSTAVGLFKSGIGALLIIISNSIIKRFNEYGVW